MLIGRITAKVLRHDAYIDINTYESSTVTVLRRSDVVSCQFGTQWPPVDAFIVTASCSIEQMAGLFGADALADLAL
jgi:hypothetical protein